MQRKVLALVLAGGEGRRLFPLTAMRSKPSVPFGGRYRIVDFVLSNIINSGIYSIYLLVQYKSQSLISHIQENWSQTSVSREQFITIVPPQMRKGLEWFQGTADAVLQNVNLIQQHSPTHVVIFGSDHIYRMDIAQMLDFHEQRNAKVTVAAIPVPIEQASAFGVIKTAADSRIERFEEKPKNPSSMPEDPTKAFISMGNYIFNTDVLLAALADAQRKNEHDFGGYVLPTLVSSGGLFAYDFSQNTIPSTKPYEEVGYWRDVGTIKAYWDSNMDMLDEEPIFDIYNNNWPIHPTISFVPPAKIISGDIQNCSISNGVRIKGASIKHSIIRSSVVIEEDVEITDSIILERVHIKKGAKLNKVIIDKNNVINEGETLGLDPNKDRFRLHIDECGIGILPKTIL
ncbi:glucose-1-phosphate adenylyltransferase [Candidatus Magnetominusculus xianensis]|uniref:Glucose-1-phosphate adenylyltransferase n=1 Tax=Candidatus Magnetominusculus xianensis TaxID=1748249 RepID=A0ABR5SDY6_9BACT|nr:glucose-1-phosphate adenylyltransferase [Candidatus Magnetominusculus xianensis]KWT84011.1 glucose-1-phosphate adenylyltransferase [Candidatus Magnetominusculus xianensis]MBF0405387.1 glucose-1-phosphate adenylyltransferase [Nitrospirota bacterium]